MQKKIIAICGATASGKTNMAIAAAQKYNTEILSFDSRQCYIELNIGVAKPTTEELQQVPHHFINSHSIHSTINAAVYEQYALHKLEQLFAIHNTVIVVGGTGLYLNALCNGVDAIPPIPEALRVELQHQYNVQGLQWLQAEIKKHDNSYTNANDLNNAQRMLRALEVVLHTGNTIKHYHNQPKPQRAFIVQKYAINLDRELLYQRINSRVDVMIAQGLEQEAKSFIKNKEVNALQTVGYSEWWPYFNGDANLATTIEAIKQHTRNYAKRQLTWFKRDAAVQWISAPNQIN
jgi:tRNA dimethylallyltransferase